MKLKIARYRNLVLMTVALLGAAPATGWTYTYLDPAHAEIALLADTSLSILAAAPEDAPSPRLTLEDVRAIHSAFEALPLDSAIRADRIELKYKLEVWRDRAARRLSGAFVAPGATVAELDSTLAVLSELNTRATPEEMAAIQSRVLAVLRDTTLSASVRMGLLRQAQKFAARQAQPELLQDWFTRSMPKDLLDESGPAKRPEILPLEYSPFTFDVWSKMPEMARYKFDGDAVWFRGVRFEPGDIVLIDYAQGSSGQMTGLSTPRTYIIHSGIFVILEKDGVRLPSVLEVTKIGMRALPLNSYLSPDTRSYAEVYRLKERPAGWSETLAKVGLQIMSETYGYNLTGEDSRRDYLTCATATALVLERSGAGTVPPASSFPEQTLKNLTKIAPKIGMYLAPSDFAYSPRFQFAGWVDNRHPEREILREVVLRTTSDIWSTRNLHPARARDVVWEGPIPHFIFSDIQFDLLAWGVRQLQTRGAFSGMVRKMSGMGNMILPIGTGEVMALIEMQGFQMDRAYWKLHRRFAPKLTQNFTSIEDTLADPAVRAALRRALGTYRQWFDPPPTSR